MVYESDFYTTRRPYRPSYSTYTTSYPLSRQVRILPGLGKVHVVHSYDRIVPYVGHKRLTVVTLPPKVYGTRSSVLQREYDWIENKVRPWVAYSPTNRYLNSDSSVRYVYVRNPISGLKYHAEYNPSRYYNFYRIIRPFTSYDDLWPYYTPYYYHWPAIRSIRSLDLPLSNSLERKYDLLAGLYGSYYRWLNNYHYYKYVNPRPRTYSPSYSNTCYYCHQRYGYHSPICYNWYYPISRYEFLDTWFPRRSYYWSKYLPICYSSINQLLSPYYFRYFSNIFDDETRLIRAQTASLLKQIHLPIPRIRTWPITPLNRYGDFKSLPAKYSNDTYIHKLLTVSPNSKIQYATYYTEPVKKYIGDKSYSRRRPLAIYEDALKNDIQLLSYYINKFREEKAHPKETKVPLSASRPSRIFSVQKPLEDPVVQEIKDLREARAARLAKIYDSDDKPLPKVEPTIKSKQIKEEARLAEEKAIAEEKSRKELQAKKEAEAEAARKAELARQEQLAAQAAAERAAELERQAEKTRQEELAKQAEIEKARQLEEERIRQEEQRRLEEEAKAEEERKQLLRLEEIARQAEEEKEAELARQAEELAELARQEAERAELERKEREEKEKAQREAELAELARQEAELAELERQEKELAELAKQEAELAAAAQETADAAAAEEDTTQEVDQDTVTAGEEAESQETPAPVEEEVQEEEVAEESAPAEESAAPESEVAEEVSPTEEVEDEAVAESEE